MMTSVSSVDIIACRHAFAVSTYVRPFVRSSDGDTDSLEDIAVAIRSNSHDYSLTDFRAIDAWKPVGNSESYGLRTHVLTRPYLLTPFMNTC